MNSITHKNKDSQCDKFNNKILKHNISNVFLVFYSDWCPFC